MFIPWRVFLNQPLEIFHFSFYLGFKSVLHIIFVMCTFLYTQFSLSAENFHKTIFHTILMVFHDFHDFMNSSHTE